MKERIKKKNINNLERNCLVLFYIKYNAKHVYPTLQFRKRIQFAFLFIFFESQTFIYHLKLTLSVHEYVTDTCVSLYEPPGGAGTSKCNITGDFVNLVTTGEGNISPGVGAGSICAGFAQDLLDE